MTTHSTENITMDLEGGAPVSLTLNCLSNVKNLVDVSISRGAYKPNEVSTVGKVYDEFVAALTHLVNANANANANDSVNDSVNANTNANANDSVNANDSANDSANANDSVNANENANANNANENANANNANTNANVSANVNANTLTESEPESKIVSPKHYKATLDNFRSFESYNHASKDDAINEMLTILAPIRATLNQSPNLNRYTDDFLKFSVWRPKPRGPGRQNCVLRYECVYSSDTKIRIVKD